MAQDPRPSIPLDLEGRYDDQKAGGAFDVKKTLGAPHTSPPAGRVIDSTSATGQEFQAPNGFQTKINGTQLKVVQTGGTKGVSKYVRGLDNRRYSSSRISRS